MSSATMTISAPQNLGGVFQAEFRSILRQGGLRIGLFVTLASSLAMGAATLALLGYITSGQPGEQSWLPVTVPLEVAASVAGMVFAMAVVMHVGRNMQNGTIQTALICVPNRQRLLRAQYSATALVASLVTAASVTTIAAAALILSPSRQGLVAAAVGVVTASIAAALTASLSQSVAILLGKGMAAVMSLMLLWIVAPLLLAMSSMVLPGPLSSIAATAANWTPLAIHIKATTVSTLPTTGFSGLLQAMVALLILATALAALTHVRLGKRDF